MSYHFIIFKKEILVLVSFFTVTMNVNCTCSPGSVTLFRSFSVLYTPKITLLTVFRSGEGKVLFDTEGLFFFFLFPTTLTFVVVYRWYKEIYFYLYQWDKNRLLISHSPITTWSQAVSLFDDDSSVSSPILSSTWRTIDILETVQYIVQIVNLGSRRFTPTVFMNEGDGHTSNLF